MKYYVYGLVKPGERDNIKKKHIRYIGSTRELDRRLADHLAGYDGINHKNILMKRWVEELSKENKIPEMVILKECTSKAEMLKVEKQLIQEFAERKPWFLFNIKDNPYMTFPALLQKIHNQKKRIKNLLIDKRTLQNEVKELKKQLVDLRGY